MNEVDEGGGCYALVLDDSLEGFGGGPGCWIRRAFRNARLMRERALLIFIERDETCKGVIVPSRD